MVGRKKAKLAKTIVTGADVAAALQDAVELDIAELARAKSTKMLDVLVDAAERKGRGRNRAPWAVATSAAKSVIEIGHGRVATQEQEHSDSGLTIIVNNLFGGEAPVEKTIEGVVLGKDIADAMEIEGPATNLAQDLVDLVPVLSKPPD